jgi:hypothetical protein
MLPARRVQLSAYVEASIAKMLDERARQADTTTSKYLRALVVKDLGVDLSALRKLEEA